MRFHTTFLWVVALLSWTGAQLGQAQAPADINEMTSLRQRLDAYEAELHGLRSELQQRQNVRPIDFTANSFTAEVVADSVASTASSEPTFAKVDIISKPTVTVFGRALFDHIMYEDAAPLVGATGVDRLTETGFSTIRLGARGNVYENVLYCVEFEFEGTETDYKDCFIEYTTLPVLGNVRVGHFKEPFSLEESNNNAFNTFMYRSLGHGAFVPSRNFGAMAYNYFDDGDDENWSWFAGTFRNDSPDNPTARASEIADEGDWCFTGRIAGLPYYDEPSGGRYLLHVGGAYSYRNDLTQVTYASRPELGSQSGYLTTNFPGDRNWHLFGSEVAMVWGPVFLQSELYVATPDDDATMTGGYVQASYFLTGESRAYSKEGKVFSRLTPFTSFFCVRTADGVCKGSGAWEVAVRYSWVDLDEGTATPTPPTARPLPGDQRDISVGVNWYWNPYTRMMFDYVYEDVSLITGVEGFNNNFGMRFQVGF